MSVKRYNMDGCLGWVDAAGDWVRYDDHVAEMSELQAIRDEALDAIEALNEHAFPSLLDDLVALLRRSKEGKE